MAQTTLLQNKKNTLKKKVWITAHRGASGLAPENTLASLGLASRLGADYAEIDVQETADGQIVLLHDKTLFRTTRHKGKIWKLSLSEVKQLDAGFWFSPDFSGEQVPTLEEAIAEVRGKLKLNIELKASPHQKRLTQRVVEIVEKLDFVRDCLITSFNLAEIRKVKRQNREIKAGVIFSKMPPDEFWETEFEVISIHKKLAKKSLVDRAHQTGKEVHVWTVNKARKMKQLMEAGVDNIITNFPNVLAALVKGTGEYGTLDNPIENTYL